MLITCTTCRLYTTAICVQQNPLTLVITTLKVHTVHDCPLYIECPDVLSPVGEISGNGWGSSNPI